ncbi:YHR035W [Zygosaccharomyces parabailii]|nr:YHR035W [Zygosaccharomyces parabailii]CDH16288.1 uncharacterized protein ZBAI_08076 [Zygosaccharomyces bailii ISA1307]
MSWFNYSVLPASRKEALKEVGDDGHVHCLYQPLMGKQVSLQGPFKCSNCRGCYGASRIVESQDGKHWICVFCNTYNNWVADMPDCESYITKTGDKSKDQKLAIVVDTICDTNELQALQKSLTLDPQCKYALVTLQRNGDVTVHSPEGSRAFSSSHHKVELSLKKLNGDYFTKHLKDPWYDVKGVTAAFAKLVAKDVHGNKRAKRATGLALFLASLLADQVMCFLTGPCTEGPGKVVSKEKRQHMRQQQDIDKSTKYVKDASNYYSKLAPRASFAIFASSLDQVGFMEMSEILDTAAQFDSFTDARFDQSLQKYFQLRQTAITDVRLTVVTSERLLVDGVMGRASPLKPSMRNYSDTPRGVGNTNNWALESFCVDPSNLVVPISLSVLTGPTVRAAGETVPEQLCIQFQLKYTSDGGTYLHVHTQVLHTSNSPDCFVVKSFNPKIEIAYLMKVFAFRTINGRFSSDHLQRVRYSLDNEAIRRHQSQDCLKLFYCLRRTPLFTTRNVSPDERTLFLQQVLHSNIDLCLLYALPTVLQYRMGAVNSPLLSQDLLADPSPALIDGGNFVGVRYAKESTEVDLARKSAKTIASSRFPRPLFIDTKIGGSKDRFFKSKLIPMDEQGADLLETQDISLENFIRTVRERSKDS